MTFAGPLWAHLTALQPNISEPSEWVSALISLQSGPDLWNSNKPPVAPFGVMFLGSPYIPILWLGFLTIALRIQIGIKGTVCRICRDCRRRLSGLCFRCPYESCRLRCLESEKQGGTWLKSDVNQTAGRRRRTMSSVSLSETQVLRCK